MSIRLISVLFGFFSGGVLGMCMAPLWMTLKLPMRAVEIWDAGTMPMCAVALSLGAMLGSLRVSGFLPEAFGVSAMLMGGMFVGMFAASLEEAVEVVPVMFDRLSISADMRYAAAAMAIGKTLGAVAAGFMGV